MPSMGARHPHPTTTDGGSAGFASLHGCNLLGQCKELLPICPRMDGSRAMHMYRTYGSRVTHGAVTEEQLPRSKNLPCG